MAAPFSHTVKCPHCRAEFTVESHSMVDVVQNPELKEKVIGGELLMSVCPQCASRILSTEPFIYSDPSQNLIILYSPEEIYVENPEGKTFRQVRKAGELIEKIKIFDAGLDDAAVEMLKFITAQELGKSVDLKFLRLDGADNEIILTYPENGQMEMLSVGFNVYEDCRGILQRNPGASEEILRRR